MAIRVWGLAIGGIDADAFRGQTRPPERTVTPDELRAGAFDQPPDWLWVVEPSARPAPGCLDALIGAAETLDGLPAPVLIASHVASSDPLAQPVPRLDKELEIAAAERGVVAVRAVAAGTFLVRPDVVSDQLERGEMFAYTARLLRDAPGYLVPASEASLDGRPSGALAARAATLVNGTWRGPELAWFALRLLADARRAAWLKR